MLGSGVFVLYKYYNRRKENLYFTAPTAVSAKIERIPFFCQLDNETHPANRGAYKCKECLRMVCTSCYDGVKKVGLNRCPYCQGDFIQVQ